MKFSLFLPRWCQTGAVVAVTLAVTGWTTRLLEQPAWQSLQSQEPALRLDSLGGALGQGITVGLLGGLRAIVADFVFIESFTGWEDMDVPTTQTGLKLTTAIDPRPVFFWDQGGSMIAHDMPYWRIEAEGGLNAVSPERVRIIDGEQARIAIDYLQEGLKFHPASIKLYLDLANISQTRLHDLAATAEYYRRAASLSRPSWFCARMYARTLIVLHHERQAYEWLVQLYPRLPKPPGAPGYDKMPKNRPPPDDQVINEAAADTVLELIRELEKQLMIPPDKSFHP